MGLLVPRTVVKQNFLLPESLVLIGFTIQATVLGKLYSLDITSLLILANQGRLFYLYLTPTGQLVASQSPNSVGPGTSSWVLVGAFYVDNDTNSIGFGKFVSIDGPPTTQGKVEVNPLARSNFPMGFTSVSGAWWRRGSSFGMIYNFNGALAAGVGATEIEIYLPLNVPPMPPDNVNNPQNNGGILGWCSSLNLGLGSTEWRVTGTFRNGTDEFRILTPGSSGTAQLGQLNLGAVMHFRLDNITLTEWTDNPLWSL